MVTLSLSLSVTFNTIFCPKWSYRRIISPLHPYTPLPSPASCGTHDDMHSRSIMSLGKERCSVVHAVPPGTSEEKNGAKARKDVVRFRLPNPLQNELSTPPI